MAKGVCFDVAVSSGLCFAAALVALATSARTTTARAVIADWQTAKPYTALVSSNEANFVFALPARDDWEWRLPETRLAGLEYEWTVHVRRSDDQDFQFGYMLFNFPSQEPSHGDLRTLLRQGQWSVGQPSQGGGSVRLQKQMKVQGMASPDRLVLTISDPATFHAIFSNDPIQFSEGPVEATFAARIPGQPVAVRTVPITYIQ